MNLEELKQYRIKRLNELNSRKEAGHKLVNSAVDEYRTRMKATESEVVLTRKDELSYELTVQVDDFKWKSSIDLRFDSKETSTRVFAILENIFEIQLLEKDNKEFFKSVNDSIRQAIDKDVSRFNRRAKGF